MPKLIESSQANTPRHQNPPRPTTNPFRYRQSCTVGERNLLGSLGLLSGGLSGLLGLLGSRRSSFRGGLGLGRSPEGLIIIVSRLYNKQSFKDVPSYHVEAA